MSGTSIISIIAKISMSLKPIFGLLFEWPLKTGFTVYVYGPIHDIFVLGPYAHCPSLL